MGNSESPSNTVVQSLQEIVRVAREIEKRIDGRLGEMVINDSESEYAREL